MEKRPNFKGWGLLAVVALGIIFISGCGTVPKKIKEEVSGIKSRVETLETKVEGVEAKQAETERAAGEQAQRIEELKASRERAVKTNIGIKTKPAKSKTRIKEIQACLKNALFYDGKIDGIRGRGTRKAIKEFQKANNLNPDGVVGPKTWEVLSKYASGSASPGAAESAEEGAVK